MISIHALSCVFLAEILHQRILHIYTSISLSKVINKTMTNWLLCNILRLSFRPYEWFSCHYLFLKIFVEVFERFRYRYQCYQYAHTNSCYKGFNITSELVRFIWNNYINLCCVPSHKNILGIERANELVKKSAFQSMEVAEMDICPLIFTVTDKIR